MNRRIARCPRTSRRERPLPCCTSRRTGSYRRTIHMRCRSRSAWFCCTFRRTEWYRRTNRTERPGPRARACCTFRRTGGCRRKNRIPVRKSREWPRCKSRRIASRRGTNRMACRTRRCTPMYRSSRHPQRRPALPPRRSSRPPTRPPARRPARRPSRRSRHHGWSPSPPVEAGVRARRRGAIGGSVPAAPGVGDGTRCGVGIRLKLVLADTDERVAAESTGRARGSEHETRERSHHHVPFSRRAPGPIPTCALGALPEEGAVNQRVAPAAIPTAPTTKNAVARLPLDAASFQRSTPC